MLVLSIACYAFAGPVIGVWYSAAGPTTIVEWDGTQGSTLDKYDATDGNTITETDVSFSASGAAFGSVGDELYWTATDGNNITLAQGTIEFKFFGADPLTYSRIIQIGTDYGAFSIRRDNDSTQINFEVEDVNAIFTSLPDLWDSTERTLRFTWDSTANERKLYINGIQDGGTVSDAFSAPTPTGNNFYVGNGSSGEDRPCKGTISDVKIWATVETP